MKSVVQDLPWRPVRRKKTAIIRALDRLPDKTILKMQKLLSQADACPGTNQASLHTEALVEILNRHRLDLHPTVFRYLDSVEITPTRSKSKVGKKKQLEPIVAVPPTDPLLEQGLKYARELSLFRHKLKQTLVGT